MVGRRVGRESLVATMTSPFEVAICQRLARGGRSKGEMGISYCCHNFTFQSCGMPELAGRVVGRRVGRESFIAVGTTCTLTQISESGVVHCDTKHF